MEEGTRASRGLRNTNPVGVWEARPSGTRLLAILRARFLCTPPRYGLVARRPHSAPPLLALIEQVLAVGVTGTGTCGRP